MDLNELKSLWETENRFQAGGKATRSEEEIRGILRRKSQTHWRAIRRNTLIEMSLILLALLGVGLIVRAQHIFVLPLEWLILWVLAGLGLLFYGVKYWRLGQLPDVDLQLEAFLRIRIRRLRSYMRLYRIVVVGLVPILGTLGVDGPANLFFLNPKGIVFGEDASLDIAGSFLATTAGAIAFQDGTQF
ncbi:MAG: filamentous hemagglutinin N-terminal domain-containing protein, partial [Bacteroidota bacterium]